MPVKADLLEKIKTNLNINIYEAKIWIALLSRGIATASQLADISGVPRSRCYDVLETLEKEGFIITKLGKPIRYIAIEPEEIIERQKKVIDQEAKRKINHVDMIKGTDIFKELDLLHNSGVDKVDIDDLTCSFKGRNEVRKGIRDIIKGANKSIIFSTDKKELKSHLKALESADNKVSVLVGLNEKEGLKNNSLKVAKTDFDSRFVIADGNRALFMTGPSSDDEDHGIMVKSPFIIKALESLFKANMH